MGNRCHETDDIVVGKPIGKVTRAFSLQLPWPDLCVPVLLRKENQDYLRFLRFECSDHIEKGYLASEYAGMWILNNPLASVIVFPSFVPMCYFKGANPGNSIKYLNLTWHAYLYACMELKDKIEELSSILGKRKWVGKLEKGGITDANLSFTDATPFAITDDLEYY
ncbi:hypothetical protein L6452_36346 [Arctium lappa]|uniref:Uncharacterized protein n=1 Tax=Arctium lappa TaxID=4217 RepID=A0ACB8YAE9_ARCLA|nr:hypothetical protein L6452_36346 [Arctium lappa]